MPRRSRVSAPPQPRPPGCGGGGPGPHWAENHRVTGEVQTELEDIADRLYRLRPGDFTAARDEAVARARSDGDRELARTIGRLRRPTLAAWASNLLARQLPQEADRLLSLGEALRQAHHELQGEELRRLAHRQRQLTGALARQAVELTAAAGQRIGPDAQREVEDTLRAVLADPEAARAWAEGRLTRPLHAPAGFRAPAEGAAAPLPSGGQRRRRNERAERAERAREAAEAAEQERRARAAERDAARASARDAAGRLDDARRTAEEAAERLREAEAAERRSRERLAEAEEAARAAAARAERLAGAASAASAA
ncbi:hypothetical protein [Streptomyces sp. 7-21]|uniref:hypothetical protein n=1 Tax=Streptomyces sp. 7-21 TaxID=2802283 RepID=UPI0027DD8C38|nr:hypothetical protein [Streptomyces sp. 7-21]